MDLIVTEAALAAARQWNERAGAGLTTPVLHGIIEAALPHLAEREPAAAVTMTKVNLDAQRLLSDGWDKGITPGGVRRAWAGDTTSAAYARGYHEGRFDLAIEHEAAGNPARGLDGQWLATQLEQLGEQLGKLQALVVERRTEIPGNIEREEKAFRSGVAAGMKQVPPIDYPKHWTVSTIQLEQVHRERMAKLNLDAARTEAYAEGYRHGREVGQPEAIVSELVTGGPSDYEVWAAALSLAVDRGRNQLTREELLDLAAWFWERLQETPVQLHDDGALLAHEDTIADDDEDDCPNCGSDDDEHEEDCPRSES